MPRNRQTYNPLGFSHLAPHPRRPLASDVDMLGYRGLLVRYPQPFSVIL
jgi:hypothetical protein